MQIVSSTFLRTKQTVHSLNYADYFSAVGTKYHARWGSHIPVMDAIFAIVGHEIKTVLEVGMGENSTPFFLAHDGVERLISLEAEQAWVNRCQEDDKRHIALFTPQGMEPRTAANLLSENKVDLGFVDGNVPPDRGRCAQAMVGARVPYIILHDRCSDADQLGAGYRYSFVDLQGFYKEVIYMQTVPPTSLIVAAHDGKTPSWALRLMPLSDSARMDRDRIKVW